MIKTFRYLIDTTKAMMAAHPGAHVITDSHAGGVIVALCPITEGNEPICEGQYSFAPYVQRALEHEAEKVAFDSRLANLVRAAFMDGRNSTHGTDRHYGERAWENSGSRAELKRILADKAGS